MKQPSPTFAKHILDFLFNLQLPFPLPKEVGVLDVHKDPAIKDVCSLFYQKFYNSNNQRSLILGINPGRFGGGVTGIPFTDPIRLQNACGIENNFVKKQELSSVFIYNMINIFGGPQKFYEQFYISSVSPLGFVKAGKNLNYYDDKNLMQSVQPFAVECINRQLSWGLRTDTCFCLGEGENYKYLQRLNEKYKWFTNVVALPHPRFIMQYKLKHQAAYIDKYLSILKN